MIFENKYIKEFEILIKNLCKYGVCQPRNFLPVKRKRVVYLEMPKVANTSIKASILGYQNLEDSITIQIIASEQIVHELNEKQKDYFKFTFVRNPFERLVSCYESKYKTDQKYLGKELEHLWYDYYLFGYIKKDKGFDSFVRKIYRIPNCLKDFHFIPQYNIIFDKKKQCMVDYVGKIENIDKVYPKLCKKYMFDELPHMNRSEKKTWMDYYTKKTAQMVYQMYRKDIVKFGYTNEYKKLIKYLSEKK